MVSYALEFQMNLTQRTFLRRGSDPTRSPHRIVAGSEPTSNKKSRGAALRALKLAEFKLATASPESGKPGPGSGKQGG